MVWKPIKCILRHTALFRFKAKRAFLITLCYILMFFYDVNLTISPFDRPITAEFTKGFHEDVTYQHPLFVNNSNNNHYFTNVRPTLLHV